MPGFPSDTATGKLPAAADLPQLPAGLNLDGISKALQSLSLEVKLPGEALAIKILETYLEVRKDMDPDVKKGWDRMMLQQAQDVQRVWRGIWVRLGIVPIDVPFEVLPNK